MQQVFQRWTRSGASLLALTVLGPLCLAAENRAATDFHQDIQPLLTKYCYDCHGDGAEKGKVSFDTFKSDSELLGRHDLWLSVLKNTRAGMMPPAKKPQPTAEELARLAQWVKFGALGLDPANPDPGHVTVRRLNRVEYHNTIKDLLGVDFDTQAEFPPDDTGRGFDNLGDVLTLPPMLLEKYMAAAQTIVAKAVPATPAVPAERMVLGKDFHPDATAAAGATNRPVTSGKALTLSYYAPALVTNVLSVTNSGRYQLVLDFAANERYVDNVFDYNKCRFTFKADGEELLKKEFTREGNRPIHLEFTREWKAGDHQLTIEVEPLTPDQKQVRSLTMRIDSVTLRGPMDEQHWVKPEGYARFFPKDPPKGAAARRKYARELLVPFVTKAYRRPVDDRTLDRLVALAEATYQQPGKTFEAGIGQAMTAVLASPRFLFREESAEPLVAGQTYPLVDEYALASRLSYFFWATMPDAELFRLAGEKALRKNLDAQVRRMMVDDRFQGFIRNFVGQWLQTRDMESLSIDARQVLAREAAADPEQEKRRTRFRALRDKADGKDALTADEKKELEELRTTLFRGFGKPLRAELNYDLRRAMRLETEKTFDYIVRENRSLRELLDGDYTFLNERLAKHYGLTNLNVVGDDLRRVTLPAGSPRGGILTQGTILAVTSNPTRTSPVKRGLFILDNILGTPPPPPPPDVTPLEDAAKGKDHPVSLRETLALHREKPLCSSCHNRMDPLGLALENFNAMGMFRDAERSQPIDATGTLISGESFTDIRDLKHILATKHSRDFYHTLTEKMLTYALGRGLEAYDVETVDQITDRLMQADGKPSALFAGIVSSAPFQKTRATNPAQTLSPLKPVQQRADARLLP